MRKTSFLIVALLLTVTAVRAQYIPPVEEDVKARLAEWQDLKFGMFIHWGLYSILEGSYNGHTMPDSTFKYGNSWYAEWIKPRLEIPDDFYNGLVSEFNPVKYDPESLFKDHSIVVLKASL